MPFHIGPSRTVALLLATAVGGLLGTMAVLASAHHMAVNRPVDRLLVAVLLGVLTAGVGWLVGATIAAGLAADSIEHERDEDSSGTAPSRNP